MQRSAVVPSHVLMPAFVAVRLTLRRFKKRSGIAGCLQFSSEHVGSRVTDQQSFQRFLSRRGARCLGSALVIRAVVITCDFAGAAARERAMEASEIFTKSS